jgi:hypothetical protein
MQGEIDYLTYTNKVLMPAAFPVIDSSVVPLSLLKTLKVPKNKYQENQNNLTLNNIIKSEFQDMFCQLSLYLPLKLLIFSTKRLYQM